MSDKKSKNVEVMAEDGIHSQDELNELKKEMRSAKLAEWAERNQKNLMTAVGVVFIALLGVGLLLEQNKSHQATAATTYQQALAEVDQVKKKTMLESVSKDFSGSSYGALAEMQLAVVDIASAETHLKALIGHKKAMQEWVWQAQLDLAELKIAAGDKAAALAHLEIAVGKQYKQLRYYLLAEASEDVSAKQQYLQQALDAESVDESLKKKIESLLVKSAS